MITKRCRIITYLLCLVLFIYVWCSAIFPEVQQQPQQQLPEKPDNQKRPKAKIQTGDVRHLKYQLQLPKCEPHVEALIVVHSALNNFIRRNWVRTSWGHMVIRDQSPLRLIFLLGIAKPNDPPDLQSNLLLEQARYGDIVQGSFVDAYRNLTYKHLMVFKWFLENCSHAQILLKLDDDVYLNVPQLLQYWSNAKRNRTNRRAVFALPAVSPTISASDKDSRSTYLDMSQLLFVQPYNLIFCLEQSKQKVHRSPGDTWYVTREEYSGDKYPDYCAGLAIIYSANVVERIYSVAHKHEFFWIDDVHITGTLAESLYIPITDLCPYIIFSTACADILDDPGSYHYKDFLICHYPSVGKLRVLWKHMRLFPDTMLCKIT